MSQYVCSFNLDWVVLAILSPYWGPTIAVKRIHDRFQGHGTRCQVCAGCTCCIFLLQRVKLVVANSFSPCKKDSQQSASVYNLYWNKYVPTLCLLARSLIYRTLHINPRGSEAGIIVPMLVWILQVQIHGSERWRSFWKPCLSATMRTTNLKWGYHNHKFRSPMMRKLDLWCTTWI